MNQIFRNNKLNFAKVKSVRSIEYYKAVRQNSAPTKVIFEHSIYYHIDKISTQLFLNLNNVSKW